jgi:hypothetical protein
MVVWPAWLGTKLFIAKAWIWLAHRATTGPGVFYFWKRWRTHPRFWFWFAAINVVSIASLFALFMWVDRLLTGR